MTEPERLPGCEDAPNPEASSDQIQQAPGGRSDVIADLLRLIAELQLRTAAHHRKLEELQTLLVSRPQKSK